MIPKEKAENARKTLLNILRQNPSSGIIDLNSPEQDDVYVSVEQSLFLADRALEEIFQRVNGHLEGFRELRQAAQAKGTTVTPIGPIYVDRLSHRGVPVGYVQREAAKAGLEIIKAYEGMQKCFEDERFDEFFYKDSVSAEYDRAA